MTSALAGFRICDFTGQLAGAGATKWLASFGAEVIRIEDPEREGRWDILRGNGPFTDERRGIDFGGAFNNHNTDKLGITLNLRTEKAKEILTKLIEKSDVVTENFAKGVLEKWGFGYEQLKKIKPDIIYVSNCGFGHAGPYSEFRTWGPIVQAISGLTFTSALPNQEPAGWGYSYMDHTGGYYMAMAILMALIHKKRTSEGQWVDFATTDAALGLHGPTLLDWTVNGKKSRQDVQPSSNRSQWPVMAPHGIYPCKGDDEWVSIACRDESDWQALRDHIDEDCVQHEKYQSLNARLEHQDELDQAISGWTSLFNKFEVATTLNAISIPAAAVQKPNERIDQDPSTESFGLWPHVHHTKIGDVRVDGQPVHFSKTDWQSSKGGPCLSEHTEEVLTNLLGYSNQDVKLFVAEGVV
jgi:benzylsuccinate CoA-transferase BbsF subunit